MKRQTDFNYIQSYDYETLARRFDCFVGPNYETGEIESGIDRLTIVHPPYDKNSVENTMIIKIVFAFLITYSSI